MKLHKEGYGSVIMTFIAFAAVGAILFLAFGVNWPTLLLTVLLFLFSCFTAYFFRDPLKVVNFQPDALLSSADGKVVAIKEVEETEYLHSKCIQISVFMSVFNVHVNYYPISGEILYSKHHWGKYLVACHAKSSVKNERTSIAIKTNSGAIILMRQIAGYVARRIVCYAKEGAQAVQGEQLGFIKFGSRVDFFIPLGSKVCVKRGDKVRACDTIIARLVANE